MRRARPRQILDSRRSRFPRGGRLRSSLHDSPASHVRRLSACERRRRRGTSCCNRRSRHKVKGGGCDGSRYPASARTPVDPFEHPFLAAIAAAAKVSGALRTHRFPFRSRAHAALRHCQRSKPHKRCATDGHIRSLDSWRIRLGGRPHGSPCMASAAMRTTSCHLVGGPGPDLPPVLPPNELWPPIANRRLARQSLLCQFIQPGQCLIGPRPSRPAEGTTAGGAAIP